MITVTVNTAGYEHWQSYAQCVMDYLMPQWHQETWVDIDFFQELEQHADGYCHGDDYQVFIEICDTGCGHRLAVALAHELVHARQNIQHDGIQAHQGPGPDPWEQEAYALESQIAAALWSNTGHATQPGEVIG